MILFILDGDQRISLRDKIFREAVSNIIAHREYLHGTPGRLVIYKDKVLLSNPCTPYYMGVITPENLKPFARNPVICQFLIQLGRFERIGSGVTNLNRYLPLYVEGAKPIFEEEEDGFRLTIPLVVERLALTETQVTPEVTRMLRMLQKEMSRNEIMVLLGLKDSKHVREHYLQPAIGFGFIEMTIPDKPRSKHQSYRLTEKGRRFLRTNGNDSGRYIDGLNR